MSNQIFRTIINRDIIYCLLDKICDKIDNKYYLLNNSAFKKAIFYNLLDDFCSSITENYYKSKQYYVTRKLDYNKFVTIIRQICKGSNINYISQIIYEKSHYYISYKIYIS